MVYYAQDSAQFIAWNQLTDSDLANPAALTTETLYLGSQYEAFKVWGEYVRRYGNIDQAQARELIEVVIDGWILLQVARRIDSSDSGSTSGKSGITSDAAQVQPPPAVDHQLARRKAKEGALDVLGQILEFDVARLLHHFERFVSYKA